MDVRLRRALVVLLVLVALPALLGITSVTASSPRPVVALNSERDEDATGDESTTPDEDATGDESATADPCLPNGGGTSGGAGGEGQTAAVRGTLSGYVRPVVDIRPFRIATEAPPTEAPPTGACLEIQLSLNIRAPDGRRPVGIGALLGQRAVDQGGLEAGFDARFAAGDRRIQLLRPPPGWELVETFCTCLSGEHRSASAGPTIGMDLPAARLLTASVPSPVVALGGQRERGNRTACGGLARSDDGIVVEPASATERSDASTIPIGTTLRPSPSRGGTDTPSRNAFATQLATAPRPVVAIGPTSIDLGRDPVPLALEWDENGAIDIRDIESVGGVVLCEWTIEWAFGDLIIETMTQPPGAEGRFSYRLAPASGDPPTEATSVSGASAPASTELRKGGWTIELLGLSDGWGVKESSCTELDGRTPSAADGSTAIAGIDSLDEVRCQFVLSLVTLKPGAWVGDQHRGKFSCRNTPGIPTIRLPANTKRGSLEVLRDGDVLVATGLADGGGSIRLRRTAGNPLRYKGLLELSQGGADMNFKVTLRVIDAENARVDLSAKFRYAGARCTAHRRVVLRFAGE